MKGREREKQAGPDDQAPDVLVQPPQISLCRLWPILVLIGGLIIFVSLDGSKYLTLESLRLYRADLETYVANYTIITLIIFAVAYVFVVVFSLPGASVMTVTAGFLFGVVIGTGLAVVSATAGATGIFLVAKTTLGDPLRARAGSSLKKMELGFNENAFSYLLILRLVPLFPFFLINLVPAFLGVNLRIYVSATAIGIIPGTFVYAQVGAGLDSILVGDEKLSIATIFSGDVLAALIGLAILCALPIFYKFIQAQKGKGNSA